VMENGESERESYSILFSARNPKQKIKYCQRGGAQTHTEREGRESYSILFSARNPKQKIKILSARWGADTERERELQYFVL
jgi:hypothetical protein